MVVATSSGGPMGGGTHTVVGVFADAGQAERALNGLKAAGFPPEQVSVVAKDRADTQQLAEHEMTGEGPTSGAVAGGILGGLAGFVVGISAMVVPGIGPIVGAGILLSTLAGAGIGAATGGLIGALMGHGVPEEDARGYEAHVDAGRILLTVHGTDGAEAAQARAVFDANQGQDVRHYGSPH